MAGAAHTVMMPLWQKGHGMTLLPGNLLDRMLGDGVIVRHVQRTCIADVQLFLTSLCFALGTLHRNACGIKMVAQGTHDMLFLGGLEDMVILVVTTDWRQVAKTLLADLIEAFLEQEELQLGCHQRLKSHLLQACELTLEHGTWRVRYRLMGVVVQYVAQHHCGTF